MVRWEFMFRSTRYTLISADGQLSLKRSVGLLRILSIESTFNDFSLLPVANNQAYLRICRSATPRRLVYSQRNALRVTPKLRAR